MGSTDLPAGFDCDGLAVLRERVFASRLEKRSGVDGACIRRMELPHRANYACTRAHHGKPTLGERDGRHVRKLRPDHSAHPLTCLETS